MANNDKLMEKLKAVDWRQVAMALGAVAVVGLLGLLSLLWYFSRDLPAVTSLRDYRPPQTTRVYDRNEKVIGEIFLERRTVIPMSEIPRVLVLSVLAAEDADFYEHEGLDYVSIARAVVNDVLAGGVVQGASTITQQVVKVMLLTPERTISRKLRELILARRLENELTKEEILHLYLNHINFGHGRYGVQEAARYYFGKDASELTLGEASLIAGLPQAPSRLSPRRHPEAAARRQSYVLYQLEAKREVYWPDLALEEIEAAREEEVQLVELEENGGGAPEIITIAKRTLYDAVGDEALQEGGYEIFTTIDLDLQREARAALQSGLQALDKRQRLRGPFKKKRRAKKSKRVERLRFGRTYAAVVTQADDENERIVLDIGGQPAWLPMKGLVRYNPKALRASEFVEDDAVVPVSVLHVATESQPAIARLETGPQGAVFAIEPRSRDVLALVGSYEAKPGFNRAIRAVRQPGSAFKPFVYAVGIQSRRFTPASLLVDAPAVYDEWKPRNYEVWDYQGAITLRVALAKSINMVAVRLIEQLHPTTVINFAQNAGITTKLEPDMGLALGASGVHLDELTNAYATFAAGGRWEETQLIREILAPDGQRLQLDRRKPARDVMTADEAYVVTSMLRSVVEEGTGAQARRLRRPLAGKTGTSNEARDAWFVGYSPSLVAGVWVGFDDHRPLGKGENGSKSALPIWIDVMAAGDRSSPETDFARPSGVLVTQIDPETGLLAYEAQENAIEEVFLTGTAPLQVARPPDVADPGTFVMEQFGGEEDDTLIPP